MSTRLAPLFLSSILLFAAFSCSRSLESRSEFVLGTVCTISLPPGSSSDLFARSFARIREIDGRMSANTETSELAAVNANAGIAPVRVHADLLAVASLARDYAERSHGAFDPTIGPLVKLWDIGGDHARVPSEGEIRAALILVDWRDLIIDTGASTLYLRRPGMRLDLGAIAKGYAADEARRILIEGKVARAIIDLGGNILALGKRAKDKDWRIGVQEPSGQRGAFLGVVPVSDKTLVTSGIYERFLEVEGTRYHHILSTRSGYPVDNSLVSVTIIAERSIDADALSTTLFALGWEQGVALLEQIEGATAIFVFADRNVRRAGSARQDFTLTDESFQLAD